MINRILIILIAIAFVGCGIGENDSSSLVNGKILKVWESNGEKRQTYYLVEASSQLKMISFSPATYDKNNPGKSVIGKRVNSEIIFESSINEYYILKENGRLDVVKDNEIIDEAIEVDASNSYQLFPCINIAIKCPCKLEADSNSIKQMMVNNISPVVVFNCKDGKDGDLFAINALLSKDSVYTEEEIISGIINSLDSNKLVSYELKYIGYNNAIEVYSPLNNSKFLSLFTNKSTINFSLVANDSLETKFNNYINSIIQIY